MNNKQEYSKLMESAKPFIEKGDIQGARAIFDKHIKEKLEQRGINNSKVGYTPDKTIGNRNDNKNADFETNDIKSKIDADISKMKSEFDTKFAEGMKMIDTQVAESKNTTKINELKQLDYKNSSSKF